MGYLKKFRSKMRSNTPFSKKALDALCSKESIAEMNHWIDVSITINERNRALAEMRYWANSRSHLPIK